MTQIRATGSGASSAIAGASMGNVASAGSAAHTAMSMVAGKVAKSITQALNLTQDQSADQWQGNNHDPYEIEELTEAMAKKLGGSASDIGELSRALHEFAQESAALFAARPESRSLAVLQSAIDSRNIGDTAATMPAVAKHIDAATLTLRKGML